MIPVYRPYTDGKEIEYLKEVIDSGWWGLGPKTKKFEEKFANYIGVKYAVGLNSGTAALDLAFRCIGIENKEVITTSMTFVSTNHAILYNKGIPVFCDIEPDTLNIDADKIEELITEKTKAIVIVHYGGYSCNMSKVTQIAKKHNLYLVEDCAHACGGKYLPSGMEHTLHGSLREIMKTDNKNNSNEDNISQGKAKMLGSLGDFGVFSFHAVKNLSTGDGGMLVTNNKEWYERLRELRWVGITKDTFSRGSEKKYSWFYDVVELGYKYHMNDITAAIGLAQLEKLDWMNNIRRKWSDYYREQLAGVGDIECPIKKDYMFPACHNFVIKTSKRDKLREYLQDRNIATGVHYYPNHLYDMYKPYYRKLPVTESIWKRLMTLPLFPALTQEEIDFIIKCIKDFFNEQ